MKKKAFTLDEALICIGVMGAIAALILLTIRIKPNANMVLFRKAYNTVSNTVAEMLETPAYYSSGLLSETTQTMQKVAGEYPNGEQKFCKIFASYINVSGSVDCSKGNWDVFLKKTPLKKTAVKKTLAQKTIVQQPDVNVGAAQSAKKHYFWEDDEPLKVLSNKVSFSTADGIDWFLPPTFSSGTFASGKEIIGVDINGIDEPPNCLDGSCKNPDRFYIYVAKDGKVSVETPNAILYLKNARKISK